MADYDALAKRLGIPALLVPRWKAMAGAPAAPPPAPASAPAGPRPGDPGFATAVLAPPAPIGPPAPPPPAGPRPGEAGFGAQFLAPPPAPAGPPAARPAPAPGPSKPWTAADIAASNASIEQTRMAAAPGGVVHLKGDAGERIAAASKASSANAQAAHETATNQRNLAEATFADGAGQGPATLAPSAPVLVDKGGRRPASWQVQEGLKLSDETKQAAGDAEQHGRTAAGLEYMAGTAQAEYERGYLDRFQRAQDRHAQEERARAEQFQRQYDEGAQKYEGLLADVRAAKVDPYEGQPGLGRLMDGIAIALGAFGASVRGGPNTGLEAVKHRIATTINAQQAEIDRAERGAKGQATYLGALRDKFGSTQAAHHAAWAAYLEKTKVEAAKIMASPEVADPKLQARYEMLLKGIDGELAHHRERWDTLEKDRIVRHDVMAPPRYAGGGAATKPDELFVPTGPNGQGFRARTEKEAISLRGLASAKQQIVPMLERLKELRRKTNMGERFAGNKGLYESERMAEIKSLQAQVAIGLRELSATSPGAMDKGMQELAGQIQGDWTSTQGHPEAAADSFINSINRQLDSGQRGQGGQDERQQLAIDAKGTGVTTKSVGQPSFASPKGEQPKSFRRVDE